MKKIFLISLVFLNASLYSQTEEERLEIMKKYEKSSSTSFDASKYSSDEQELTLSKALELNIPSTIKDIKGDVGYLVRFDGVNPLYYKAYNSESAITSRVNLLQPGGSMGLNLNGASMIGGVWDQNHPRINHADFNNRLQVIDGSLVNVSFHSTHVSGTMFSSGQSSSGLSGRGMAYAANGWVFDWSNDFSEMNQYAGFGLLVSNHSYGLVASQLPVSYFGNYVSDSAALDAICFNRNYYLPIFAAGNDRDSFQQLNPTKGGLDLLTSDTTAKNGLVVGAVASVLNYTDPSSVSMSSFSNWGPTDDFRIKPDLVAKGVDVFSTSDASTTSYSSSTGTSMAAPGVAGALLLVQQFVGSPWLKSATLKGLALHTASESGSDLGPDHMFGWGLLDASQMVQALQNKDVASHVEELTLNNGEEYILTIHSLSPEDIKVSISWTDRAGTANSSSSLDVSSSRLVNDLDLRVSNEVQTYFPWKLNKDFSNPIAQQADNDVDPFERVDVLNSSGFYQVKVSHKGTLVGGSQDYSLIVTGVDVSLSFDDVEKISDSHKVWQSSHNKTEINFEFNDTNELLLVDVFDLNGRIVFRKNLDYNSGVFNIPLFEKGVYVLSFLTSSGKKINKKIII